MRLILKISRVFLIFTLSLLCDLFTFRLAGTPPPPSEPLQGKKVALLVDNYFQIDEAYYARFRLQEAGAEVKVVSHHAPTVFRDTFTLNTDMNLDQANDINWDAVYIIGGFSPLEMREDPLAVDLVVRCHQRGGLVAAICHGVCMLTPTGILKGRRVTGNLSRAVEYKNAGAVFYDTAPQIDANLITAISDADNGPLLDAMIHWFRGGEEVARQNMMNQYLQGKKVAIILDNRYSYVQHKYPLVRLFHNGADVKVVAAKKLLLNERKHVDECMPDMDIAQALKERFDLLILTGDWAADTYRRKAGILEFIKINLKKGTLISSINEGHTAMISAGVCTGYHFATTWGMQADIINAGGQALVTRVHRDRNLITCAREEDLPLLMREIVRTMR